MFSTRSGLKVQILNKINKVDIASKSFLQYKNHRITKTSHAPVKLKIKCGVAVVCSLVVITILQLFQSWLDAADNSTEILLPLRMCEKILCL